MKPSKLIIPLLASALLLAGCGGEPPMQENLPWQIETHADQTSTVFGIHLGEDTALDMKRVLDKRATFSFFKHADGKRSIEGYYGSQMNLGGLTSTLISVLAADEQQLDTIEKLSTNPKPQPSGALKFELKDEAFDIIKDYRVFGLNVIPYINFDEDVITQRFGVPAQKVVISDQVSHWLYPDKGLAILVNADGREMMQYVAPKNFGVLRAKIEQEREAAVSANDD